MPPPESNLHWRVIASVAGLLAVAAELVGRGDVVTTARTNTHVLGEGAEVEYAGTLR